MRKEEAEQLYLQGEQMVRTFKTWGGFYHNLGNNKISEKQFNYLRVKYLDKSDFVNDFGGMTKHIFNIKNEFKTQC